MPYSTLIGADDQPCDLAGYGPIPADMARTIAADAVWHRLVTDPRSGALLDYGRTTYRPPAALADFVRARDIHCRAPGCDRAAARCEIDHVVAWADGGTTAEHNLTTECTHDHHLKHAPGWTVLHHRDGKLEWITPTGHRYVTNPFAYPTDHTADPPPAEPEPDPAPARGMTVGDWVARRPAPDPTDRSDPHQPDDDPPPF